MICSSPLVYRSAVKKLLYCYLCLPAQTPNVLKDPLVPHLDVLLDASKFSLNRPVALYSCFLFQSLINGQRNILISFIIIGMFCRAEVCAWREFKGS